MLRRQLGVVTPLLLFTNDAWLNSSNALVEPSKYLVLRGSCPQHEQTPLHAIGQPISCEPTLGIIGRYHVMLSGFG